ncbi:MAG: hypothetical protein CMJ58_27340 [Planctomycetaceae bacterium]|nr:hypothetical protein [Planctomycetaceae bacterium]
MKPLSFRRWLGCAAFALVTLLVGPTGPVRADVTDRHREIVQQVFERLLQHVERPEIWEVWPPELQVIDPGYANAFAGFEERDGQEVPHIVVTVDEIEQTAEFDPDILAYTIGHELGHLIHDHSHKQLDLWQKVGDVNVIVYAVSREAELEADVYGAQLTLAAGYTLAALNRNVQNTMGENPYCRFESLAATHPSWLERSAHMQTDEVQRQLWRSMSAFHNGVFFLQNEQYLYADACFRRVIRAFPSCYEAWANLGYAQLMMYCDALELADIRRFDIGHLVVGGFYQRPKSLQPRVTRSGINADLWWDAVGALREALRIQQAAGVEDGLLLIKANLAVAYLVHPDGKDVGTAERYFSEVLAGLENPSDAEQIDPLVRAAILINAGAGRLADDSPLIQQAVQTLEQLPQQGVPLPAVESLQTVAGFNQAKALAKSSEEADRRRALQMLERYLRSVNSANAWWPLAYDQYVELAKQLQQQPLDGSSFADPNVGSWRPVTRVSLGDDLWIGLGEPLAESLEPLGAPAAVTPVAEGTIIALHHYPDRGLSVLAGSDVLAVLLSGPDAPAVQLQRPGLGAQVQTISVGMPASELEALLGDEWVSELSYVHSDEQYYHLYRDMGIAVLKEEGKIAEIAVVIVPREDSER